jgi:hypothetical protein
MADAVQIREVGMRDGLQSIADILPTETKLAWLDAEYAAGVREIEVSSFVPPKLLPQLADAEAVVRHALTLPGLTVSALIPNSRGAERGLALGVHEMNFVLSVSEGHNLSNVRRATGESVEDFRRVVALCREQGGDRRPRINCGLATAFGCTIEGDVDEDRVRRIAGEVAAGLSTDDRISAGQARRGGPGTARTLALGRAQGDLVKVLDADDQLTPGALARDIAVLSERPDISWTTSRVLDLLPDGSTVGFDGDPAGGPLGQSEVLDYWLAHNYRAPVHPATLCIRRDLLLQLGGWMALPASEDTGLLIAASVVSDGYFITEPGLLYRKWPGQATAQAAHTDPEEWAGRMKIIENRARSLPTVWRR